MASPLHRGKLTLAPSLQQLSWDLASNTNEGAWGRRCKGESAADTAPFQLVTSPSTQPCGRCLHEEGEADKERAKRARYEQVAQRLVLEARATRVHERRGGTDSKVREKKRRGRTERKMLLLLATKDSEWTSRGDRAKKGAGLCGSQLV